MDTRYFSIKDGDLEAKTTTLDNAMVGGLSDPESETIIVLKRILAEISASRTVPLLARYKLPLANEGYDYLEVYETCDQEHLVWVNDQNIGVRTFGVRMRLGNMVNGQFKPSNIAYVLFPKFDQDIIKFEK